MMIAALALARGGWPVFPLRPRDKVPLIASAAGGRGVLDATVDQDQIRRWWSAHPTANIGLATGKASSLFVVDVDDAKGGTATMRTLVERHGKIPPTRRSRTGGGWHLLFELPARPVRMGANVLGPGVDTRSTGGYIVAPPSVHPNGTRYRWLSLDAPAPLPEWIVRLAAPPPVTSAATPPARPGGSDVRERAILYLRRMEPSIQGQNGSARALWAAVALVRGFDLDPMTALELLLSDFNPRCEPPWSRRELEHKVKSAERSPKALGFLLNVPRRVA